MTVTLQSFMNAIGGQESGNDSSGTAQNGRTGAYGTYQIMPANWPSWSREAGLPAGAPQNPQNQQLVAQFKMNQYYQQYGNWNDVASVWYSGQPMSAYTPAQLNRKQGNGDEPSIAEYVNSVVGRAGGSNVSNSSTSSGGASYKPTYNPDTDPDAQKLKKRVSDAITAAAAAPNDPVKALAVSTALKDWGNYVDFNLAPGDPSKTAAQQAFTNSIALGDLDIKGATAAYQNWAAKANNAVSSAQTQITDTANRQKAIGDMTEARNQSSTPGLMPRSLVAGYNPAPTKDIIQMYLDKNNAANPDQGYTAPGAGDGTTPAEPFDPRKAATLAAEATPVPQETTAFSPPPGSSPDFPGEVGRSGYSPPNPWKTPAPPAFWGGAPGAPTSVAAPSTPGHGHDWWKTAQIAAGPVGWASLGVPSAVNGLKKLGGMLGFEKGTASAPGGKALVGEGKAKDTAATWWRTIKAPHYAAGTTNHPGGQATVGENGTETAIYPGGVQQPVGVYGPEVADLPAGTKIVPAGVPPEEAQLWSQIQDHAKAPGPPDGDMLSQQRAAEARAADPNLIANVRASLLKALAGLDATAPPTAPMPYGGAQDKFAAWRPLHTQMANQQMDLAAQAGGGKQ